MWYVECHNCGNKIWEGQKAVLADVNEGVGRFPFCSDQCLFKYLDALHSHVWKDCDDEYVWKEEGIMSVLWTEEKIEEYKKDPISLAYDSGHVQGWNDRSWDSKKPRVFSKDDCPSYRKGYCDGWAAASSFYVNEGGEIDDDVSDEQRNYWIEGELSIIKFWEKNHAECSDEDCISDEDAKKSWLEVVECMERVFVSDNKKRGEAK